MKKDTPFSHLRPTTAPEMLDRAYQTASRFWPVLLITGVVYASDHLFSLVTNNLAFVKESDPLFVGSILALALLADYAAGVALLAVFQGLIFPLRPIAPRAILRTALRKLPGFFLTHLLYLLVVSFAVIASWGFITSRHGLHTPYNKGIGIALGVIGLAIAIRFSLASISCLIEENSPFSAFRRSWHLTSMPPGKKGRYSDRPMLRWIAIGVIPALIALGLAGIFSVYAYFISGVRLPVQWRGLTVSNLVDAYAFVASIIAMPLYWAGLMAMYVEYRMRHEALDFYLRLRELRRKDENVFIGDWP